MPTQLAHEVRNMLRAHRAPEASLKGQHNFVQRVCAFQQKDQVAALSVQCKTLVIASVEQDETVGTIPQDLDVVAQANSAGHLMQRFHSSR
jgi:hypothetical protein